MSRPRWLDELWVAKPLSCLVARKQCDGGVQVHESQSHGFGSSFNAPKDSLKLPRACITMAMAIYFLTIEYCGSYYIILDAELEYIRMRMRIISCNTNTNTSRNKCTFVMLLVDSHNSAQFLLRLWHLADERLCSLTVPVVPRAIPPNLDAAAIVVGVPLGPRIVLY